MRNISFKSFFTLLICLLSTPLIAQDVHFSQFGQTPQLINPGATGVYEGNFRSFLNYRNQWGGLGNGYKTYAASFDTPLKFKDKKRGVDRAHLGLGLNFYSDVAGKSNFRTTQAGLSLAGVLPLDKNQTISLGIQSGYGQMSASLNQLTWGSQFNGEIFDPQLNSNELIRSSSAKFFDLGAGFYYQYKDQASSFLANESSSFNVGVAGYHLNQPALKFLNNTSEKLPIKIIAQFSADLIIGNTPLSLVPSMFFATQAGTKEITPGMLLKFKKGRKTKYSGLFKQSAVYVGTHVRMGSAFIPQLYLEFTDYMIGLSYDMNNSDLSRGTGGVSSIEISFRYIHHTKAIRRASF